MAAKAKKPDYLESESEEDVKPLKKESAASKKAKKEPSVCPAHSVAYELTFSPWP